MKEPQFDENGVDSTTFAPFVLRNALDTEWKDVRLEFSDWEWLHSTYGDTVDDYYLNGYGVEGLVLATRLINGLPTEDDGIDLNSEGSTCYIHFTDLEEAAKTAEICAEMIKSPKGLREAIRIARKHGLDDS